MNVFALTSLIRSRHNPVGRFCREALPGGIATQVVNRQLPSYVLTLPDLEDTSYPWQLAGAAFDYRMRMFFDLCFNFRDTVVGALKTFDDITRNYVETQTEDSPGYSAAMADGEKLAACRNAMDFLHCVRRPLFADNNTTARLCIVAAHLESVYRVGKVSDWLLKTESMTPEQMLASIPDTVALDVERMAERLEHAFAGWAPERMILNPVLGRSSVGADGDLILDDCLIEIKAIKDSRVRQRDLYQLACYGLLDRVDRHGVGRVGLYLARHGALFTWTLPEFLMLLGANTTDVDVMRTRFDAACDDLLGAPTEGCTL